MFIEVAKIKALALMVEHGLVQNGWTLKFNRKTSVLGQCWHSRKIISLSTPYVENNEWEPMIKDTVIHEIAHYFCPPVYIGRQRKIHHSQWKRKCIELGCLPERSWKSPVMPPKKAARYIASCSCDTKHEVRKKGKHFHHYICRRCRAKLVFRENPAYA